MYKSYDEMKAAVEKKYPVHKDIPQRLRSADPKKASDAGIQLARMPIKHGMNRWYFLNEEDKTKFLTMFGIADIDYMKAREETFG